MHPLFCLGRWSSRILWSTSLEAILEFSGNALHVSHTSSTSGLSPLSLLAPVVCNTALASEPSSRVPLTTRKVCSREKRTLPNLSSWVSA